MKVSKFARSLMMLFALSGVVACSSSGDVEEAAQEADSGLSGIDATTQRAQQLQSEAERRAAEAQERIQRAALQTTVFYFDFDIAEFRPADRDVLTFHGQDLAANPGKSIRLEGHADERGTREYNLALGERRAQSIMNFLIVNGASRSQIEVVSYGEERPADAATSEAAYQRNRRVEVISR
jgi:peptidoglycan-associated lipoprotein